MTIVLGSDHRGFALKQEVKQHLLEKGYTVIDVGTHNEDSSDYPDFAYLVAQQMKENQDTRGILFCGSGVGIAIAANKIDGILCGFAIAPEQVTAARFDDDINALSIASDYTTFSAAVEMIEAFLTTPFSGKENHARRLEKIAKIEKNTYEPPTT